MATKSKGKDIVQQRIKLMIEEARKRAPAKKPYVIESTGRGRIKCHADAPDRGCPRCRHRLLVRRLRESAMRDVELIVKTEVPDQSQRSGTID